MCKLMNMPVPCVCMHLYAFVCVDLNIWDCAEDGRWRFEVCRNVRMCVSCAGILCVFAHVWNVNCIDALAKLMCM